MNPQVATCIVLLFGACSSYSIPEPWQTALMARYIIHNADWVSIATISSMENIKGYPFVNLKSMSDGPVNNGTGNPYLFMNDLDMSGKDVLVNSRITVMATLADSYCKSVNYDPQDPRCGRLLITGRLIEIPKTNVTEYSFAQNALYSRHPSMKMWSKVHTFYIAKVNIEQIVVLDYFGGAKFVKLEEYFDANTESSNSANYRFDDVFVIEVKV